MWNFKNWLATPYTWGLLLPAILGMCVGLVQAGVDIDKQHQIVQEWREYSLYVEEVVDECSFQYGLLKTERDEYRYALELCNGMIEGTATTIKITEVSLQDN